MSDAVNNPYFSDNSAQLTDLEEGGATDIDDVDVPNYRDKRLKEIEDALGSTPRGPPPCFPH